MTALTRRMSCDWGICGGEGSRCNEDARGDVEVLRTAVDKESPDFCFGVRVVDVFGWGEGRRELPSTYVRSRSVAESTAALATLDLRGRAVADAAGRFCFVVLLGGYADGPATFDARDGYARTLLLVWPDH